MRIHRSNHRPGYIRIIRGKSGNQEYSVRAVDELQPVQGGNQEGCCGRMWNWVGFVGALFVARRVAQVNIAAQTTVAAIRPLAVTALLLLAATGICRGLPTVVPGALTTSVQYLAVILLLVPGVYVLGARRPGISAWPWFVITPMVIVLFWPAAAQLWGSWLRHDPTIPTPTLLGTLFVLLMSAGNYLGTALTIHSLLFSGAIVLFLMSVAEEYRIVGDWPYGFGVLLTAVAAAGLPERFFPGTLAEQSLDTDQPRLLSGVSNNATAEPNDSSTADVPTAMAEILSTDHGGVNSMWADFRDVFGLVWARRVADRVNQFSLRERWNCVLSVDGFVERPVEQAAEASTNSALTSGRLCTANEVPERAVRVLCWVLRRFVDEPFLQRYGMPFVTELTEKSEE